MNMQLYYMDKYYSVINCEGEVAEGTGKIYKTIIFARTNSNLFILTKEILFRKAGPKKNN